MREYALLLANIFPLQFSSKSHVKKFIYRIPPEICEPKKGGQENKLNRQSHFLYFMFSLIFKNILCFHIRNMNIEKPFKNSEEILLNYKKTYLIGMCR